MPTFPSFRCMHIRLAFIVLAIVAALVSSLFFFVVVPPSEKNDIDDDVYWFPETFRIKHAEMKKNLKVYVYPNGYSNTISVKRVSYYAVEDHFFRNLRESQFLTSEAGDAHFFFIPFSFHKRRFKAESNEKITLSFAKYVEGLILKYPYWNNTLGLNHFLLSCYGGDVEATRAVPLMVHNSIRLVCASNYSAGFIPHKDVTIPSVMQPFSKPSKGNAMENRTTLAYWAGVPNSETRKTLVKLWWADKELNIKSKFNLSGRIEELQSSKFCICPVGSRNSNSRITMAILNGCVPVILEDYIDLPFNDVLDWQKFSLILNEADVYNLKDILKSKAGADYRILYKNLIKVQRHLQWDTPPVEYDAFHMIMSELWLRHSTIRY